MVIRYDYNIDKAVSLIAPSTFEEFIILFSEDSLTYEHLNNNYPELSDKVELTELSIQVKLERCYLSMRNSSDSARVLNSFFINARSNIYRHAELPTPACYKLWKGNEAFILSIEQFGKGFNAEKVDRERIADHLGGGFQFFRETRSEIFFDNPTDVNITYLLHKF